MEMKPSDQKAERLITEYIEGFYRFNPGEATSIGMHAYDAELEDRRQSAIDREIKRLDAFLSVCRELLPAVSGDVSIDCRVMAAHASHQLLLLRDQREWSRNPLYYNDLAINGVFILLARKFAPWPDRAPLVIKRASKVPQLLSTAQENLKSCPRILVKKALELFSGIREFYDTTLPDEMAKTHDRSLIAGYQAVHGEVSQALNTYEHHLRERLLPQAGDNFAIGAELFSARLRAAEMVDLPLDVLRKTGMDALHETQDAFRETAARIGKGDPRQVYETMSRDHPAADQLVPSVKGLLEELRTFCIDRKLCTIPSEDRCTVEPMPSFMWAFAAIWPAGILEENMGGAEYYVAPVKAEWPPEKQEEHLQNFNYPGLINVSVHEAWPGHFLESLFTRRVPRLARKIFWCYSAGEGWAHYAEQLMVEQAYGNGDPKLKLAQLSDALLRLCRYCVAIGLHTGQMSVEDGIRFFEREGYLNHHIATEEAVRGTFDPMYLNYALGKLMILKLRRDYQAARGDGFSLQQFHDDLLRCGSIPIPLIREILLGGNRESVL